jgi:phospholipase C
VNEPRKSWRGLTGPRPATPRRAALVASVLITFLLAVPNLAFNASGATPSGPGPVQIVAMFGPLPTPGSLPIKHIVFIMQENHAYDNFFGTYCTSTGPDCPVAASGIPNGTCEPYQPSNPSDGCIIPSALPNSTDAQPQDIGHDWNNSHEAYNNGSMNDFYAAEGNTLRPFRYYDGSTIPVYWDWAQQYALGDDFFSPYLSYSLSNHWDMFAGTAPNVSQTFTMYGPGLLIQNNSTTHHGLYGFQQVYLNESNATPTFADQVLASAAAGGPAPTWKYYDTAFTPGMTGYDQSIQNGTAWNYWNPSAGKAETYLNPALNSHYVARNQIFSDLAAGDLPQVSWVLPNDSESDHPELSEVPEGEGWVSSLINAIELSSAWSSTAIFVSWDEYGGYFDNVAPPQIDGYGFGFRVPLLIISPYVREGYVDHQLGSFDSVLHLMEWMNGLPPIGTRATATPLPLDAFDFQQTPRLPFVMENNTTDPLPYPQPFQSEPAVGAPTALSAVANGTGMRLDWTPTSGGGSVDSYSVEYGPSGDPTEFTGTVDGAANGAQIMNLTPNSGYVFQVQARGPDAASAASAQVGSSTSGWVGWVWSVAPYLLLGGAVVVAGVLAFRTVRTRRKPAPVTSRRPPRPVQKQPPE